MASTVPAQHSTTRVDGPVQAECPALIGSTRYDARRRNYRLGTCRALPDARGLNRDRPRQPKTPGSSLVGRNSLSQQDPNTPPSGQQPPPWGAQPQWGAPPSGPSMPPYRQPLYVAPPKPGIVPLRPLMFGEIMDGSFQTIRRNAKAMLGAALLAQSLSAIVTAVVTAFATVSAGSIEGWIESRGNSDLAALGFGIAGGVLLFAILTLIISAVLQGAMVVPVARSILNRQTGFRQMWALARSRAGALIRLAGILFLGGLLAAALFVAAAAALVAALGGIPVLILLPLAMGLFVVMIWIYIKLMVAPAAIVVEEIGALDGIRRSWQLTRGDWWRILGITLVVSIMVGVIAQIVMIPISLLSGFLTTVVSPHGGEAQAATAAVAAGIVAAIVAALVGAVGYAFQTSVMALLYLDLRMRKDGLDIALLRLFETGADPQGVPGRGLPGYGASADAG